MKGLLLTVVALSPAYAHAEPSLEERFEKICPTKIEKAACPCVIRGYRKKLDSKDLTRAKFELIVKAYDDDKAGQNQLSKDKYSQLSFFDSDLVEKCETNPAYKLED